MTNELPSWFWVDEDARPSWWARRRRRKHCWHHERKGWSKGEPGDSRSYVSEELIDLGRRKRYVCEESRGGCGKVWFGP